MPGEPPADAPPAVAVLRALNKINARTTTLHATIGEPVTFGTLVIVARACVKKPPEEPPEAAAFLEITDLRNTGTQERIFSGWMFASSPALSALEHPIYDLWMLDCETKAAASSATPSEDIPPGNATLR